MSNLYRPEAFQGQGIKKNYFEGWYFKSVSKDEQNAIALIPGISLSKDNTKSHAFVMFFNARKHIMHYFKYSLNDFWVDKKNFEMKVGKNYFSKHKILLDMSNGTDYVKAELKFQNITP